MTYDSMFGILAFVIPVFTLLVFAFVIGFIIYSISKTAKRDRYNRSQPVLTVWAKVVSTRMDGGRPSIYEDRRVFHKHRTVRDYTSYYATFEVESGDRMELMIPANEIGYLVQFDIGELTFQGTEFIRFVRS